VYESEGIYSEYSEATKSRKPHFSNEERGFLVVVWYVALRTE
jgi:hypothetical protein